MRRATPRPPPHKFGAYTQLFQSTLSMRRATRKGMTDDHEPDISIHALHEESDSRYPS